jgi:hypothetical protein
MVEKLNLTIAEGRVIDMATSVTTSSPESVLIVLDALIYVKLENKVARRRASDSG